MAAKISIHSSQFPKNVRRDLLASLRARKINHKFHYDSIKQTQKWLALHEKFSPARRDENVRAIYEKSFTAAASKIKSKNICIVGLGCGGGQKDARLLKSLKDCGKEIFYMPCDVSTAMVLVAREAALKVLPEKNCSPFVCDLGMANDLQKFLISRHASLVTFFGMIPNFEPRDILPKLSALIRQKDFLLFSANLAPGKNYAGGMKKILPQYDNELTRDWLMTFLIDLGIEKADGEMRFEIANGNSGLKRIVANFYFKRALRIKMDSKVFNFKAGEIVRLFFSYRYTPERVGKILGRYNLQVCDQWISDSKEEGVFLCHSIS